MRRACNGVRNDSCKNTQNHRTILDRLPHASSPSHFRRTPRPELVLFQWSATHRFCGGGRFSFASLRAGDVHRDRRARARGPRERSLPGSRALRRGRRELLPPLSLASAVNQGAGVVGESANGLAGLFIGRVQVNGTTATRILQITGGGDLSEGSRCALPIRSGARQLQKRSSPEWSSSSIPRMAASSGSAARPTIAALRASSAVQAATRRECS